MIRMTEKNILRGTLTLCVLIGAIAQAGPFEGYTFYSSGSSCYLYDMEGNLVHSWSSGYRLGGAAWLLRDSSVLFPAKDNVFRGGTKKSGRFQIIQWDGEITWDFTYNSKEFCPHHNIEPVYYTDDPNEVPNVFAAVYVYEEKDVLSDDVVEIKPTGLTTGEVVWRWKGWDHRTEGNGIGEPGKLSVREGGRMDWLHLNSISYNHELDQLALGIKNFNEFIIVDHSTSTAEAAGNSGGKYGRGGDILYRWGSSDNYILSGTQYLRGHHAAGWIPKVFPGTELDVPGGGNILLIESDEGKVIEVALPGNGDGFYPREPDTPFEPEAPSWTISTPDFSAHEGSVQRLPNGNTLICTGSGVIYEADAYGGTVWSLEARANRGYRYAPGYFLQGVVDVNNITPFQKPAEMEIFSNPLTKTVRFRFVNVPHDSELNIYTAVGVQIYSHRVGGCRLEWSSAGHPWGVYIAKVALDNKAVSKKFSVF